jgi:hypothetical protein
MDSDSEQEGGKEGLSNVFIIEGRSAVGKTAAVHACAAQLGFTIIEMNASHLRSLSAVKKQCSEGWCVEEFDVIMRSSQSVVLHMMLIVYILRDCMRLGLFSVLHPLISLVLQGSCCLRC